MKLTKELWGKYEGQNIYLFKLKNNNMEVALSNFGAIITGIYTPDRAGNKANIVLGYDTLHEYVNDEFHTGCVIGRYAGRIANAQFTINGITYPLTQGNADKQIHLHGGSKGFNKQAFTVSKEIITDNTASVELYYRSAHLEEGYPGNLDVWVTYQLTADNELTITYKATTDQDTHINLTNHSYFNLNRSNRSILNHQLMINAGNYLVTDKDYIPTGIIKPVTGTPFDFTSSHAIANNIDAVKASGYNECYLLNPNTPHAILSNDANGRSITLETDMPALLLYTGDYLGDKFQKNEGVCLETQFFPDTPNHPNFPSTLLKASEGWEHYTRFRFGW
jgi:aldose 1-epimerase